MAARRNVGSDLAVLNKRARVHGRTNALMMYKKGVEANSAVRRRGVEHR